MKCQHQPLPGVLPVARLRPSRTGTSLVEISVCTLLVGLVLLASLKAAGAVILQRASTADDQRGQLLAVLLMSEILADGYAEPDEAPVFGLETGETTADRLNYDDVDDFHNWSATPPENRDGTAITGLTGWQRDVTIQYVDPANPSATSLIDLGAKRITVTVQKDAVVVGQAVSLRADW